MLCTRIIYVYFWYDVRNVHSEYMYSHEYVSYISSVNKSLQNNNYTSGSESIDITEATYLGWFIKVNICFICLTKICHSPDICWLTGRGCKSKL